MNNKRETLLFLTRGNQLQITDYQSGQIVKSFELLDDKKNMYSHSFYSPSQNYYVVHGQLNLLLISMEDLELVLDLKI